MRGWTPERRAASRRDQALEAVGIVTGPRSVEGKARVARNAYRGGTRPQMRELSKAWRALLASERELLTHVQTGSGVGELECPETRKTVQPADGPTLRAEGSAACSPRAERRGDPGSLFREHSLEC